MKFKTIVGVGILVHISLCLELIPKGDAKTYYQSLPRVNFSLADTDTKETDVIYTLFTNSSPTIGKLISKETSDRTIKNKNITTVLIIHGWTTDDTSPWYRPLRDEFFKQGPHNVIFINWNKAGNKSYSVSSANVKPIGMYIAKFLIASRVDLNKVHLVGHSLGSHLASYIGKSVQELAGKTVGRITALDPAGPMFSNPNMTDFERLNPGDAELVEVIHTDIQHYGYTQPTGHVDFYANGGSKQPGCPTNFTTEEDANCSHARSTLFFIESVATKITAKEALFSEDENSVVKVVPKIAGKEVIFGQHVGKGARGVYYFKTNSVKPFLS